MKVSKKIWPLPVAFLLLTVLTGLRIYYPELDRRFFNEFDTRVFEKRSVFVNADQRLYADVFCEYPPLGCLYLGLPRYLMAAGVVGDYRSGFVLLNWAVATVFYGVLLWMRVRRKEGPLAKPHNLWFLCLPASLYMVSTFHDFPTSVLVFGGIYAYLGLGREILGVSLLGLGASMKGYPLVMVPALAVGFCWLRRPRFGIFDLGAAAKLGATIARSSILAVCILAITHIPVALSSGLAACLTPYRYQQDLGNLESLQFVIYVLFGVMPPTMVMRSLGLLTILGLLFALGRMAYRTREITPETSLRFAVASLLVFVLAQPGVSPHYNFWWELPLLLIPLRWAELTCVVLINLCYQLIWPFFSLYLAPYFPKYPGVHLTLVTIANGSLLLLTYLLVRNALESVPARGGERPEEPSWRQVRARDRKASRSVRAQEFLSLSHVRLFLGVVLSEFQVKRPVLL